MCARARERLANGTRQHDAAGKDGDGSDDLTSDMREWKVMEELRERLSTAEAAAVAKSEKALRDAEKYTAQAAQMQASVVLFSVFFSESTNRGVLRQAVPRH
eukprot:1260105-Rhodomonas_salina.2